MKLVSYLEQRYILLEVDTRKIETSLSQAYAAGDRKDLVFTVSWAIIEIAVGGGAAPHG